MSLEGRVALVTGASRGIGAGIARCMAAKGASVVVNYNRSEGPAKDVVQHIEDNGGKAIAVKADVGEFDQVESMVNRSLEHFGKVDILVNNAGIGGPGKAIGDTDYDDFRAVIQNHLMGSYYCTYLLLPYMRKYDRGDVIYITSRNTDTCPPYSSAYNAAKGAMNALTVTLAKEERYNGIRVNAVAPGLVPTDMTMAEYERAAGGPDVSKVWAGMPLGRPVSAEDIGNMCAFLASEGGAFISGEVIYVRGAVGAEPVPFYIGGEQSY